MFCATSARQYPFRPRHFSHFPFQERPQALAVLNAAPFSSRQISALTATFLKIGICARDNGSYGRIQRAYVRTQLSITAETYRKHERMLIALGLLQRQGGVLAVAGYSETNSGAAAYVRHKAVVRAKGAARSRHAYARKHGLQKPGLTVFFPPQVPVITTTQRFITGACAPSPKPKAVLLFKKEILISKHGPRQGAGRFQRTPEQNAAIAAARAQAIPAAVLDELDREICGPPLVPALPQAAKPPPVPALKGEALLARLAANAESIDDQEDLPAEDCPTSASITEAAWAEESSAFGGSTQKLTLAEFQRLKVAYPELRAAQFSPFAAAGLTPGILIASAEGLRRCKGPKHNLPGLLLHGCRQRASGAWATPPRFLQMVL